MRYTVLSVEWGIYAASKKTSLPRVFTHCVLPDLDQKVMSQSQRDLFYDGGVVPPRVNQIRTVAVNHHSSSSTPTWLEYVSTRIHEGGSPHGGPHNDDDGVNDCELASPPPPAHLLIVGGNRKNGVGGGLSTTTATTTTSLSTAAAIRECLTAHRNVIVWAVADFNAPHSINDVLRKIEAGATGIITQPLLSRRAYDSLARYSEIMNGSVPLLSSPSSSPSSSSSSTVKLIVGLALPNSLRALMFWESLLQTRLAGDPLYQDHCRYFASNGDDCQWALAQLHALAPFDDVVKGIHFMPLKNIQTMEMLLLRSVQRQWRPGPGSVEDPRALYHQ